MAYLTLLEYLLIKFLANQVLQKEITQGEFFGEVALLEPQPRIATVTAIPPCTLLELRRDRLLPYLENAPELKDMLESTTEIRILDTRRAREKGN